MKVQLDAALRALADAQKAIKNLRGEMPEQSERWLSDVDDAEMGTEWSMRKLEELKTETEQLTSV